MILLGAMLSRRVVQVCGGLGAAAYLRHLSARVFSDRLLFPLALTAIGLAVIACGIWWQRNEDRVRHALWARMPTALRGWLPAP